MKKTSAVKRKLQVLNQTRPRTPMPRPVKFRDETKYDRKRSKGALREELSEL